MLHFKLNQIHASGIFISAGNLQAKHKNLVDPSRDIRAETVKKSAPLNQYTPSISCTICLQSIKKKFGLIFQNYYKILLKCRHLQVDSILTRLSTTRPLWSCWSGGGGRARWWLWWHDDNNNDSVIIRWSSLVMTWSGAESRSGELEHCSHGTGELEGGINWYKLIREKYCACIIQ